MKAIGKKITITYRWWDDDDIDPKHVEKLHSHAEARISEMREQGYLAGELLEEYTFVDGKAKAHGYLDQPNVEPEKVQEFLKNFCNR